MEKEQVFIAIIDNPFRCDADFEYTVCDTKEIAAKYLIGVIDESEKDEFYLAEDEFDKQEGLKLAEEALIKEQYVECNSCYYRIVESNYLK